MAVISLELNELNFHFIRKFVSKGRLPNFGRFLSNHVMFETISEDGYPYLEPWIQWPTVYTGLPYAEHGIFRLGDAVFRPQPQIWEKLEHAGYKVGAVSPINATNACAKPDFFLPDPWTDTPITADARTRKLFNLIREVVNSNASANISTFGLGRQMLPLALPYLHGASLARYFRILPMAIKYKWAKAAFLDGLLADLFLELMRQKGTDFGSLFLNAGAHIQHHHMFESSAYEGERRNPTWYSSAGEANVDPLLFIYEVYDSILAQFLALPDAHVLVTTGLSQIPNPTMHYQYRIINFELFMAMIGLTDAKIEPRMSRDFLLSFPNVQAAQVALGKLAAAQQSDNPLFKVEDRGETLFCQVAYFGPPEGLGSMQINGSPINLREHFALVSIENGIHQTIGYHIDSKIEGHGETVRIPLTEVHQRLMSAVVDKASKRTLSAIEA